MEHLEHLCSWHFVNVDFFDSVVGVHEDNPSDGVSAWIAFEERPISCRAFVCIRSFGSCLNCDAVKKTSYREIIKSHCLILSKLCLTINPKTHKTLHYPNNTATAATTPSRPQNISFPQQWLCICYTRLHQDTVFSKLMVLMKLDKTPRLLGTLFRILTGLVR